MKINEKVKTVPILLLLALGSMGVTCGPPGPPPPDTCMMAANGAIATLEVGSGDSGTFQPFTDGQVIEFAHGGQGATMLPIRLRFGGTMLPACVQETSSITAHGTTVASDANPVKTYDAGDGTRTTKAIYLVIGFDEPQAGSIITVTATAGGQTVMRQLQVAGVPLPDAMPPPAPDAGMLPPDARE